MFNTSVASYRFYPIGPSMKNLKTIFIEAVEVAFIICNKYLDEYSLPKIIDIVQQIIPTAYVYGTAYWMFFSRNYGGPLCICRNFNLPCRHQVVGAKDHLDLTPIPHMGHRVIINRLEGFLGMPVNFQINFPDQYNRNWMDVNLIFMIEKFNYEGLVKTNHEYSPLNLVTLRYQIIPEKFRCHTINLITHPTSYEHYGTVFPYLQQEYMYQVPGRFREFIPGFYLPSNIGFIIYTLKPMEVTFEEALCPIFYKEVHNFVDLSIEYTNLKRKADKSTQTGEESNRVSCWRRSSRTQFGSNVDEASAASRRWALQDLQDEARALPFENLHI